MLFPEDGQGERLGALVFAKVVFNEYVSKIRIIVGVAPESL